MPQSLDAVLAHADANIDASLARLFELIRIPSISTGPGLKKRPDNVTR